MPSTVTTLLDGGAGSLREAIASTPAGGTVDFAPGLSGTITLTNGELAIAKNLIIQGPGANTITVNGNHRSRVFEISSGFTVTIAGLTVADGREDEGAGIHNAGILALNNVVIAGNVATFNPRPEFLIYRVGPAFGGGIFNTGELSISNSTISGNAAYGSGPTSYHPDGTTSDYEGYGGGIYSRSGSITITNGTIAFNQTNYQGGEGGGIAIVGGQMDLINCTVWSNQASEGGNLYIHGGTQVHLTNTLVAQDSAYGSYGRDKAVGPDISGTVASASHHLVGDGSGSNLVNGVNGNLVGSAGHRIDPRLGVLRDNRGPTETLALLPNSPALGAGTPDGAPATDQRGVPRLKGDPIDIGAYQAVELHDGFFVVGGAGRVQIRRKSDGSLLADFAPFGPSYTGGVSLAVGDVNGDGVADVVVGAAEGNPQVRVYDGKAVLTGAFDPSDPNASLLVQFFAYALNLNIGVTVAVGDVNGDGYADIVTGATAGNPQVKVYDGKALTSPTATTNPVLASFFAYALNSNIGVNVAVGDINNDGYADIITGATAGNPEVRVYNGYDIAGKHFDPASSLVAQFYAYGLNQGLGVNVAVGDINGDGYGDVITGSSAGAPHVKVFDGQALAQQFPYSYGPRPDSVLDSGATTQSIVFSPGGGGHQACSPFIPAPKVLDQFFAYGPQLGTGVRVGAALFNGKAVILTGTARGTPHFRVVPGDATGVTPPAFHGIEGIPSDFQDGVVVGSEAGETSPPFAVIAA